MRITVFLRSRDNPYSLPYSVKISKYGWAAITDDTLDVLDIEDGEEIMVAQFAKGDVLGWRMEREAAEE